MSKDPARRHIAVARMKKSGDQTMDGGPRAEGARIVTLTHKPQGTLAGIADVVLPVPVTETAQFGGSLFEQTCLILLDAVVMQLAAALPDAHGTMAYRHTNLQ